MQENWLKNNNITDCDGENNSTLKRDFHGNVIGRRDTIKTAKKKLRIIKNLHKK